VNRQSATGVCQWWSLHDSCVFYDLVIAVFCTGAQVDNTGIESPELFEQKLEHPDVRVISSSSFLALAFPCFSP
jgi:hypothetical protein